MVSKTLILSLFAAGAFARPTEQADQAVEQLPKSSGSGSGFSFPKSGGGAPKVPAYCTLLQIATSTNKKQSGGFGGGAKGSGGTPDFASILGGLKGAGGASGGGAPDFASILGGLKGAGGASGGGAPDFASILGGLKGAGGASGGGGAPDFASILGGLKGAGGASGGGMPDFASILGGLKGAGGAGSGACKWTSRSQKKFRAVTNMNI
jgi:hypothetical protein